MKEAWIMTLGEYLLKVRNERGYTSRELAQKSGISSAEISRLETGKRKAASPLILKALAKALVIDETDLMRLAGYLPPLKETGTTIPATIPDADGNAKDILDCAKEMYATDPEWFRTAYLIATDLKSSDRKLIRNMTNSFLENLL